MSNDFEPENIGSDFIEEIYEEALTDETRFYHPVEVLGPNVVKTRSGRILLAIDTIDEYSEYIDFMFGQMRSFHDKSTKYMSFQEGFIDYMNGYWTKDVDTIMKLYALGIANGSIIPFGMSKNGVIITEKSPLVIPTLNTEDPKFDDWFENVYKKQYVLRKNIGREPHDD